MKNKIKQIKIKIKGCLLVKLAKARKDVRVLRERIADDALGVQKYVDELSNKDRLIRDLLLKLDDETRDAWLKEHNYERYFDKKKRTKK
jgi:hypothetical protein